MTPITVQATVEVPFDHITNAIIGAIEGGSVYWMNFFAPLATSADLRAELKADDKIWYAETEFWERGGGARIEFDKPTESDPGFRNVGKAELVTGLNTMAAKAPKHFADLINENDDAITHDVFIQCVLFGEIVFG